MTMALISLFEEFYIVHCGTKKWNKWLQQWTGLYSGQFHAQLETKIQVKILEEELRLEKDVLVSITLLASG